MKNIKDWIVNNKIKFGVCFVVFIFAVMYVLAMNEREIIGYFAERRAEQYQKSIDKMIADREEAYRNDKYGSTTPEGTLELYIAALEKGDIEEASKYYKIDDREDELKYLKEIVYENRMDRAIDFVKNIQKKGKIEFFIDSLYDREMASKGYIYIVPEEYRSEVYGRSEVLIIPKGHKEKHSETFELNKYNNIWKIVK